MFKAIHSYTNTIKILESIEIIYYYEWFFILKPILIKITIFIIIISLLLDFVLNYNNDRSKWEQNTPSDDVTEHHAILFPFFIILRSLMEGKFRSIACWYLFLHVVLLNSFCYLCVYNIFSSYKMNVKDTRNFDFVLLYISLICT